MTIPAWPANLPHEALLGSWRVAETHTPNIMTDMNAGVIRSRRAHSLPISRVQFDMTMSEDQVDTFWTFYFDTLGSGTSRFTMLVWNGKAYVTKACRIRSATGPQVGEYSVLRPRFTFDLIVENLFR